MPDREPADISEPVEWGLDADWLAEDHGPSDHAAVNREELRAFVLERWRERAAERGMPEPDDLRDACKFSALFVKCVLGGTVEGNYDHLFGVVDGKVVDLCAAENAHLPEPYRRDRAFMEDEATVESLESCLPRVADWVEGFTAASPRPL